MYKNDEVLSFVVIFDERNQIEILEKLEHFDKAPYGINNDSTNEDINDKLLTFFSTRCIPSPREDYDKIIKAFNCRDSFELVFKGHGLSLSNHYWFKKEGENLKYEDINFFTNKWDDSFARAVLNNDYEALKTADTNVPDILTSGWGIKGWLYEDGPKLYKLGIDATHNEEAVAEVLASKLANRLFNKGEAVEYELKMINGHYASVSKPMLNINEELIPLSRVLPRDIYSLFASKNIDAKYKDMFFQKIKEQNIPGLYRFFVKLMCLRSLCFVSDLHFENMSLIRNLTTNERRIAPIYDLGGSFGSTRRGRSFLANIDKGGLFIIYYIFGGLDPNWDYSWYNKDSLNGFEDEIRNMLSLCDFYTPELIESIIKVYKYQKSSLDELSKK